MVFKTQSLGDSLRLCASILAFFEPTHTYFYSRAETQRTQRL